MDKSPRTYITAIKDVFEESFIAASLIRQGHHIRHRAITPESLLTYCFAQEVCDVTVLASESFLTPRDLSELKMHCGASIEILSAMPTSDFELAEMLRPSPSSSALTNVPLPSHLKVIALGSLGDYVGTSTCALNLAQELASQDLRTLLIDANTRSRFIAEHTEIFGVNREVHRFLPNLSIVEVSDSKDLNAQSLNYEHFERIIVDIGAIGNIDSSLTGRRSEDQIFQWMARNACELILVTNEERIMRTQTATTAKVLRASAIRPEISFIINQIPALSKRERLKRAQRAREVLGDSVYLVSNDKRNISAMKSERGTLATSAPKSRIINELAEFARARNWWMS